MEKKGRRQRDREIGDRESVGVLCLLCYVVSVVLCVLCCEGCECCGVSVVL